MSRLFLSRNIETQRTRVGCFREVVFAIFDDHNAHKAHNPEGNFAPFVRCFSNPNPDPSPPVDPPAAAAVTAAAPFAER